MGLKLRGVCWCGSCGKPRGLGTHLCDPRPQSPRDPHPAAEPGHVAVPALPQERAACGTPARTEVDFKARKRKQATAERRRKRKAAAARRAARRRQAAAERRARERARKRNAKGRPRPRPRGESHEPGTCGDKDCPKFGCKAYWAGMADCPGPHEGGG